MIRNAAGWLVLILLWSGSAASATMRCGTSLINVGDTADAVREKCGSPDLENTEGPAVRANGVPMLNAAKVSHWVYGPRNGASQYLRFIDDKLVSADTRRN